MHFYDEQSESTCLFASSLSLSLSLLRISDIISKPVIIDSPKCSLIRLLETVNLRLICPKEITKIPC